MPSIVTHFIFAKEIKEKLPISIQEKINKPIYDIFSQSFDNFFYYQFLTPWKGKEIRTFGETAQRININDYFKNILLYIKENHQEQNKDILSYLYGSINHYILDATCHPFIIYHTGYKKIDKKYIGLHEQMETAIDAYMYEKTFQQKLYRQNLANTLLPKIKLEKEVQNCLNDVFEKTFHLKNVGKIYQKSIKTGHFLIKYGVTDKTGIKKQIYKIKDKLPFPSERKYEYLSFHITEETTKYLNLNHDTWLNPTNKELKSTASFPELYDQALKKARKIILKIDKYLENKITLNTLLEEIGNNSYVTGLPWNENQELKYFKVEEKKK